MSVLHGNFKSRVASFKRKIPLMMSKMAEKHYKDNFIKGGFQESRGFTQKWEERKRAYKHPILRKTNALMNSVKARTGRLTILVTAGGGLARDYAKYHNKGNPSMNLPQRKFLDHSEQLVEDLEDMIMDELKKILS